jgi:branched-chain amino acid transport system ATP-binding protein
MLDVTSIDASYGELQVLRDVSLSVKKGELITILGPNGHGKSTLLKTICGLIKPSTGSIMFKGEEISQLPIEKIVEMGLVYVAEERELFAELTVLENLKLGAYNKNARKDESINLERVFSLFPKLQDMKSRVASGLSGGEAKMLAIGRGIMSNAELLALDEPSLGLAPIIRNEVITTIAEINKRGIGGTTIILVEQNIPQVFDIADRIYLMEEGELVFSGNKKEALENDMMKEVFLGM